MSREGITRDWHFGKEELNIGLTKGPRDGGWTQQEEKEVERWVRRKCMSEGNKTFTQLWWAKAIVVADILYISKSMIN